MVNNMQRFNRSRYPFPVKTPNLGEFRAERNILHFFDSKRATRPHASAGLLMMRDRLAAGQGVRT